MVRRGVALIGAALALGCFAGPCAASSITWSAPGLIDQRLPFAVPAGITDPTCPSVHLCVGTQAGGVEISRHPLGGASAWAITELPVTGSPLSAISCASPRLCVAVSEGGQVFTSTNPPVALLPGRAQASTFFARRPHSAVRGSGSASRSRG
jgi:hypothetical protein